MQTSDTYKGKRKSPKNSQFPNFIVKVTIKTLRMEINMDIWVLKKNNPLDRELERIQLMDHFSIKVAEFINYLLGRNLATNKYSSRPCLYIRIVMTLMVVSIGYSLVNYIIAHSNESFTEHTEGITLVFQLTMGLIKFYYIQVNIKEVLRLMHVTQSGEILRNLKIFEMDIPNKHKLSRDLSDIVLESWNTINQQVRFFFFTVTIPVSSYIIRPYFQYVYDCYLKQVDACEIPLTFPSMMPYLKIGNHEYPSYVFRFALLQIGPVLNGTTAIAFDVIFMILTLYEVGLIRALRFLVQQSTNDERVPRHIRDDYIKCCAELYVRITLHHTHVEAFFTYIIFGQCGCSCTMICMLLYKASITSSLDFAVLGMIVTYLVAILFEISIYNFDAQQVETESEELCGDWYLCNWYDESPQFKNTIQMMILFCSRTYNLSVGGFTNLSLKLLLLVFRMSGNFFLLLRNVNAQEEM